MNKTVLMTVTIASLAANVMAANNNTLVGTDNNITATSHSSLVSGYQNTIDANNALAFGTNNTVTGENGFVGGNNATAAGRNSFAFGSHAESLVEYTVAIGNQARTASYDSVAIGNGAFVSGESSVAFGRTNNVTGENSVTDDAVGVDGITINGTRHVFAGEQPASVVSFGSKARAGAGGVTQYNRQLTNVSAGQISSDSLDAVNGSQLFAAIDEIETNAKQINKNKQNIKDVAIGLNMLGDVVNDHEQAIAGNTTAITNNTNRINGNTNAINSLGQNVATNTADIRVLEKVADNHEGRITTLENRSLGLANDINNKVNNLGQRVNKLGASSAALAGLHPLEYNKNDKGSFAISYGHYRNANAIALGAFYSPNEKVRLGFGITLGGETQFNINAAFRTGRGSEYEPQAKNGELEQLRQEVETLKALVNK